MTVVRASTLVLAAMTLALSVPGVCAQTFPINLAGDDSKAADSDVKVPAYDVASVKPNKTSAGGMSIGTKQDGFTCVNISLKSLISNAYGIRWDLISGGPGWVETTGFDVEAKVAGEDVETFKKLTGRQRNSMLQALLADRFKLKVHTETKVVPTYDLVVAKDGPKFKEVTPAELEVNSKDPAHAKNPGSMMMGPGMFKGQALPMSLIAKQIESALEKTVTDKTGLKGKYDVDLKWKPEDSGPSSGDDSGESIFTALQEQLGLKLVPTKGPVETLVIDHVELPTEN